MMNMKCIQMLTIQGFTENLNNTKKSGRCFIIPDFYENKLDI